jgi:hypothetical protein
MSLAPEAIAFIGRPPAALPIATRAHRMDGDITEENPMPTGVYPRKPKATPAAKPEAPAKARKPRAKATPKAAPKSRTDGPRFGVFEDGTIELKLPTCTGVVGPDDARALVGFLRKIGIDA